MKAILVIGRLQWSYLTTAIYIAATVVCLACSANCKTCSVDAESVETCATCVASYYPKSTPSCDGMYPFCYANNIPYDFILE